MSEQRPEVEVVASIGGGPWGPWYDVEADGLAVRWSARRGDGAKGLLVWEPTVEDWGRFWSSVDDAGAWEWRGSYEPDFEVMDGSNWVVKLRHGDRAVRSRGSNAFPEGWTVFADALIQLLGGVPFR